VRQTPFDTGLSNSQISASLFLNPSIASDLRPLCAESFELLSEASLNQSINIESSSSKILFSIFFLHYKKRSGFSRRDGKVCHDTYPARESLVSEIPAGDGKISNLFLQCIAHKKMLYMQKIAFHMFC
jgi:hypothetical protein